MLLVEQSRDPFGEDDGKCAQVDRLMGRGKLNAHKRERRLEPLKQLVGPGDAPRRRLLREEFLVSRSCETLLTGGPNDDTGSAGVVARTKWSVHPLPGRLHSSGFNETNQEFGWSAPIVNQRLTHLWLNSLYKVAENLDRRCRI